MDKKTMQHLAKKYSTPFYVFDIETLKKDINNLRTIFADRSELCYAAKANTFILKEMETMIDHFEICSPGELAICKMLGIDGAKIVLSGVNKTKEDLEELFMEQSEIGIYTIESIRQYLLLEALAKKYQRPVNLVLRLSSGNQFGLSKTEIRSIVASNRSAYITIRGIQYYSGTQKHSIKVIDRELTDLEALMHELREQYGHKLNILEYGPGLPVDYFAGEEKSDTEHLMKIAERLRMIPADIRIVLEIGRRIAANCGHYFTKVADIKTNKGYNYAIVDGGIHQIAYFGQSMAMKTPPFTVLNKSTKAERENWNICGSLCTVNDIILKQTAVPSLGIGDTFIFHKAGAYCVSEGIALFLSRDIPDVILIDKDKEQLVRKDWDTALINCPQYLR